ncbi:IDEAL domain-containing protein [Cytobacillus oceanisediminis]|uniref:IDEAL domain-containing protein n=1 Tax=Cytobacillus TaxID=2675230 RepID=UPI0022282331|nr:MULTISPECIES: IDEAL domain-containing protein [Cytobacillus]MDF2035850.1 IDEAL domain-containing protein [Cytobacillus oceanisediminis]MDM5225368.1 IDEAL domain-containing protein [Cytobacillus sp. NJ13]
MEKRLLNSPEQSEENVSLLAEQVLNQALKEYRKEKLREKIDEALTSRNKEEFIRLTDELKKIS